MNEERVTSDTDIVEEDTDAGGQQRSTGCFQVSALCCCISKRRMHLPGRRPKDRKKKNEKKKNTGDGSFGDTIFEGRPQNLSQDNWRMTSAGDLGGIQTEEVKPALKVGIQTNDRQTQDPHIPVIPVTLTDICLEEKQRRYVEPTQAKTFCIPKKTWQQKEGTEDVNILSLETKNRSLGAVSEGVAFEDGKDCLVMPAKENGQSGRPKLLSSLLQGATCEEEQQHGQDHVNIIVEGVPCKQELKQDHQKMPFQELQHSAELELHSTLATNENKFQEEQNSSIHVENVTYFQELPNQLGEQHNDVQQVVGPQDIIPGVPHNTGRPMDWDHLNSVSKGDTHKEDQKYEDMPSEEAQQTTELKYPDILSTMCGNYEQEQPGVQQQQDCVTEDSSHKTEHNCLNLFYQEDQPPVIPKSTSTSGDKKKEETQAIKNSTSDTVLTKVEGHQYVPNLVDLQAATHENVALPLGMTYTMDLQKIPYMTTLPDDADMHIMEQKHPDTPQLLLVEQISTHHEEKEKQETQASAYSGSNVIAYIEEQESQEPIVSQDTSILLGNVSHEKEPQRKLECGDSGPEGLYEKGDQDPQGPVYLEMKQPLLLAELCSLPLNVAPGEELCISNDNTDVGKLEICPLDEEPEERDDQHKMHTCACFKEKETTQGQEEQQPTLPPQSGCKTEKEPQDSLQFQMATSTPYEVQDQREQLKPGMTCVEYQKEKQSLSNTTFSCSTRENEGHI
ncbi:uncharacterized protein LOC121926717 [Sceloporus undulatus]|uniref:uncharacterized protein LOC121926717 n=1 Tax=Sceloporus undulatus TaxID=8520 RepID=UPI001C4BFD15|nr:uncharacterized protein LOC121926717 [Sceloporus undulatus]